MTRGQSWLDRWLDRMAERVMDLDSKAYGDERERAVVMESSSFGMTSGLYAGLVGAVVASAFGLVLVAPVLLVMVLLPSVAAMWYAKRRGVSLSQLAENSGARSTMISIVVYGAAMVLTFAAMAYTGYMGHSILPAPSLEVTPGEGFLGGMVQGAVIGGMVGGLAAIIGGVLSFRRANRRREERGR